MSNVSQSTFIRTSGSDSPSSSICHFLYLNLSSPASGSGVMGVSRGDSALVTPTPSYQTFLARMASRTRGIHVAGYYTNMASLQKADILFLSSPWVGRFCSIFLRARKRLENAVTRCISLGPKTFESKEGRYSHPQGLQPGVARHSA